MLNLQIIIIFYTKWKLNCICDVEGTTNDKAIIVKYNIIYFCRIKKIIHFEHFEMQRFFISHKMNK